MKFKIIILILIFISSLSFTFAHSGWTDSNWCHWWSQPYHCHNSWSSSSNASYSKSYTPKTNNTKKENNDSSISDKSISSESDNRYTGLAIIPEEKEETYEDKIGKFQKAKADKVIQVLRTMADDKTIIALISQIATDLEDDSEKYNLAMYIIDVLSSI